jgi:hypothetical protein
MITLCDFDECKTPVSVNGERGRFLLCAKHAGEFDALTGAEELAAWTKQVVDAPVLEHPLQTLLEGYAADLEIREYSGRGMSGERCLAVVGSLSQIFAAVVEGCLHEASDMAPDDRTDIEDAMRQMRTDAMGYDTVVYWPGVPYCGRPHLTEEG